MSSRPRPTTVRLALVQMADAGTKDRTTDAAVDWIAKAADQAAHVVCLQELFATCYPCQDEDHANFDLAEPIDGPTVQRMAEAAVKHGVVVVAPLFERRGPGMYHNSAVVLDADGTVAGVYRKMHIPDDPLYYEKFYFTPGDAPGAADKSPAGFHVIDTAYAKLGVGICWDQWYPEGARLFALAGAEILLYPTAIGWIDEEKDEYGAGQREAWQTSMRAHAIANGLYVGAPNRVGRQRNVQFWGSSFVAGPRGQMMHVADDHSECLVVVDCPKADIDVVRTHWPFLRDRRVDAYGDLTRRWID